MEDKVEYFIPDKRVEHNGAKMTTYKRHTIRIRDFIDLKSLL